MASAYRLLSFFHFLPAQAIILLPFFPSTSAIKVFLFLPFIFAFSFTARQPNKLVVPWVLLQDWSETDRFDLYSFAARV